LFCLDICFTKNITNSFIKQSFLDTFEILIKAKQIGYQQQFVSSVWNFYIQSKFKTSTINEFKRSIVPF
jgi:hypothetical protein